MAEKIKKRDSGLLYAALNIAAEYAKSPNSRETIKRRLQPFTARDQETELLNITRDALRALHQATPTKEVKRDIQRLEVIMRKARAHRR